MKWISIYTLLVSATAAVSDHDCTDIVGSLSHDSNIVTADQTLILAGYTIPCSGIVVAWEFCYRISGATSVTFYPGVWRLTGTSGSNTDYELVQSNRVTYDSSIQTSGVDSCQRVNLSTTDQFTAPAGSVVGLYSNIGVQLLHTNTSSSITTYQFSGNQSNVRTAGNNDVNYSIAIRAHLDVLDVSNTPPVLLTSSLTTARSSIFVTTTTVVHSPTDIPTSKSSYFVTSTTASSFVSITATILPSINTQTDNGGSSSSIAVVIAGCALGVILSIIIVVLIISLVWYHRRRRKNKGIVHNESEGLLEGSNRFSSHHYYSILGHESGRELVNGLTVNKGNANDYENADNSGYISNVDSLSGGQLSAILNPTYATCNGHCKASGDDSEALQALDCKAPQYKVSRKPSAYEVPVPSAIRGNMGCSGMCETLSDGEQLYKDPGYKREEIYASFEKSKSKIKRNDIKILQALGSGEFGTVHLGLWSNGSIDPVQVAVKTLNSQCSESDRVKFLREAAIMGQFVHNNVVQLHGVVTEEENMMIVLEYMPKGDLRNHLLKIKSQTIKSLEGDTKLKNNLLSFCRQIAAGMNYLVNKQFVHRDLAARNILVSSDVVCKIADFGMARDVSDSNYYMTSGGKIPVRWTAPEAIFYKEYSPQSDVWSFGCVMFEIWSLGCKPYENLDGKQCIHKIATGYRLPPPPGCPRAIYELMIQCWHPVAKNRPIAGSVLRTLQNSDSTLLTSSTQVSEDKITKENQSVMLGAPLTAGNQLYLDLQQRYIAS